MELVLDVSGERVNCIVLNPPGALWFEVTTFYPDRKEIHDVNVDGLVELIKQAIQIKL